ncbi:MAG: FAD-binding oxidoreductase [Gammaproteobacteria bacterium]|jgi:D-amino-acid dehydrogenase
MNSDIYVLGAGMVGISCALELQRRGHRVTLVDRRGPGEETSSGNAGILSYSNVTPLASPALWPRMHLLGLNLDNDLRLHYPHLPWLLPWFIRFLWRCRRDTYLRDGDAMAALTRASIELHEQWIAEAGADSLAIRNGGLKLYRDRASFERDALERELLERCGIRHRPLDADGVYELEPDLKRIFVNGVLIEDTVSIRNPRKLCQAYAKCFADAGGEILQAEAKSLRQSGTGWELVTGQGARRTDKLVVCLGAWTPGLIGELGYRNPLAIERGYHTLLKPADGKCLSRPIFDVDSGYVMSPMEMGYRVTSGSNIVHGETPPDPRQLARALPRVREAFPVDRVLLEVPWMGRRPSVPDSLPIIGPAPRHRNLWFAFAHSHMGFTMGPITGRLIANFIDGREQPFSPAPCNPARYLR